MELKTYANQMTSIRRDGKRIGMVQPDHYNPQSGRWTSWRPSGALLGEMELDGYHASREAALAAFGYHA